jgi:hypothetical protein
MQWTKPIVLQWPSQADEIHQEFFRAGPYTHFHIHPIFCNDTFSSVRWTYTFHDMGMEFVIDKSFFISDDGDVLGDDASRRANDAQDLRRLVFDHYNSYVQSLRHLDHIMEETEAMEP